MRIIGNQSDMRFGWQKSRRMEGKPEDIALGFSEFIPQLAQAGCTRSVTILDKRY